MEQLVVDLRREHPTREDTCWPGYSRIVDTTVCRPRARHGHPQTTSTYRAIERSSTSRKRFEHERPNQLWQMDFKGHIPVVSGGRCHPLTVLDDHSRFSLGVRACADERTQTVHDHLTSIFSHYGMPNTILVDNGPPWGSDVDQPHPTDSWLVQLGVRVVHSRPYHPQTLGKLERFHRSLKTELLQGSRYTDLSHCQSSFDGWRDFYNLQRPHHALDLNTPASRYTVSPRPFPETLPTVDYDTDDQVRSVDVNGRISFLGRSFPVGKAFRGKRVALRPTPTDGTWKVFFSVQSIATIDLNQ